MPTDPTQRFSSRVADYAKHRPTYPPQIVDLLEAECGLSNQAVIADIGSGTGLLSRLLLDNGNRLFGIEPNLEMRRAGERQLSNYKLFSSFDGSAEATTLPSACIDLITAAQSFHWFDGPLAATEFKRILKPGGWVVIIWNDRRKLSSPFLRAYEDLLLEFGTDYEKVDHSRIDKDAISELLQVPNVQALVLENRQDLDFVGLRGRLLSSSYTPEENHPRRSPMLAALREIFDRYERSGAITIEYDTRIYLGMMG
jgi:SAM-dependent methyltransferase